MSRIAIIIITIINWNVGFSQTEIDLPNFEYVQVDYDLRDYISVSVDSAGGIMIEDKIISLEELKANLFREISKKVKFEGLRLPISMIELKADKDLEFQKLEPLLIELRKMSFLKIHFVCNSEEEKRTEGLKTTGYLYKLNSLKSSNSIIF